MKAYFLDLLLCEGTEASKISVLSGQKAKIKDRIFLVRIMCLN